MTHLKTARGILVALSLAAFNVSPPIAGALGSGAGLPYYESRELTPRWTRTTRHVGRFTLTAQTGSTFTDADLTSRVYVASFVYTRCSELCPRLVRSLQRVQASVGDPRFLILSFSVTPDLDTASVLASFGRERQIDPARWKLLTGDRQVIYRLARESFFASDERLQASDADAFLHTEQLVLVDGAGRIRGVYNGTQPSDVDHLIEDAGQLLAASTPARR